MQLKYDVLGNSCSCELLVGEISHSSRYKKNQGSILALYDLYKVYHIIFSPEFFELWLFSVFLQKKGCLTR